MSEHEDCRTYVDHVRIQFRHLNRMVEQLKTKVQEAYSQASAREDAKQLLTDLGDKFAAYVAEEMGGGCIDEAVCRCPRLAPLEHEINLQYPQVQNLIETIERLLAGSGLLVPSAGDVPDAVGQLAAALSKLESDERRLLREAFGTDESFSSRR